MKKYIFLSLFAALALASCDEKEIGPFLAIGSSPSMTTPADGAAYVFTEDQADMLFDSISWTHADYGYDAAVTYTLQMDIIGNNFASPVDVAMTTNNYISDLTIGDLNNKLLSALNLPGEASVDVEFRVKSSISSDVDDLYSNVITLKITPYTVIIIYPKLAVPGAYQGWDPSNETTVIFSAQSDDKYEGYMYFADTGNKFKYAKGPGWDPNWGDDGADGTLDPGGADIEAGAAGLYKLNVNLNNLTHSLELTNWGLIGDATPTGWDSDTDLVYDEAENKLSITLDLGTGAIKFRANDLWDLNLGDNDANGSLEYGGSDIVISEAGNYTVDLILSGAIYTYELTKN